jgi:hypothetical protein
VLPDTRPNLTIGPDGICNACASHQTKRDIDWPQRKAAFLTLVETAKARSAAARIRPGKSSPALSTA